MYFSCDLEEQVCRKTVRTESDTGVSVTGTRRGTLRCELTNGGDENSKEDENDHALDDQDHETNDSDHDAVDVESLQECDQKHKANKAGNGEKAVKHVAPLGLIGSEDADDQEGKDLDDDERDDLPERDVLESPHKDAAQKKADKLEAGVELATGFVSWENGTVALLEVRVLSKITRA